MATLSWPARAPKIIRHRSATCCGVPYEDSHFSSCVCSAGSNWIARLLFGMSEIVAVAVKSVKLFKGHYTSSKEIWPGTPQSVSAGPRNRRSADADRLFPSVSERAIEDPHQE